MVLEVSDDLTRRVSDATGRFLRAACNINEGNLAWNTPKRLFTKYDLLSRLRPGRKLECELRRRSLKHCAVSRELCPKAFARDQATLRQTAVSCIMNYAFPRNEQSNRRLLVICITVWRDYTKREEALPPSRRKYWSAVRDEEYYAGYFRPITSHLWLLERKAVLHSTLTGSEACEPANRWGFFSPKTGTGGHDATLTVKSKVSTKWSTFALLRLLENKDETPLFPHPPPNNRRGTHQALETHLHSLKRNILNDPGHKIIKIYMSKRQIITLITTSRSSSTGFSSSIVIIAVYLFSNLFVITPVNVILIFLDKTLHVIIL